jgi:acetyl esterase/lipase
MVFKLLRYLRLKLAVLFLRFMSYRRQRKTHQIDRSHFNQIQPRRVRIPSRDAGRFIDAWLYEPPASSKPASLSAPGAKTPILINWHGSGFVMPSLGSDHAFCVRVATEVGIPVLDADYSKGPERPFPASIHDVEDTLRWVEDQAEYDARRVTVSGFSAGGNLALVAASSVRHGATLTAAGVDISAVFAVYPPTDLTLDPLSKVSPKPGRTIPPAIAGIFDDSYVPDPAMRADPRVSPINADPATFPATVLIQACEIDTLHDEAAALATRLDDGSRHLVFTTIPGAHHGFDKGCEEDSPQWGMRDVAYSQIIREMQQALKL